MPADPLPVRLGVLAEDGIAPGIYAIVARGVERRPDLARTLQGEVSFFFEEGFAPVRVAFGADEVLVEDGESPEPDVVVTGRLPDIVALTVAPTVGGVPNPLNARGRSVLGNLATGRVKVSGNRMLGRRLLALLQLCLAMLVLGACGAAAAPPPALDGALHDTFSRPDGLVTNEFALYTGGPGSRTSSTWIATSGSLFARGRQGWTGVPDATSPDVCSCRSTDSAVFRLVTRRADFGDVAVSFRLTNRGLTSTRRTPRHGYDGVHVFLRYHSEAELYVVAVNRRDGEVVAKKKLPGGSINGGRYVVIGRPATYRWRPGVVQRVRAAVRTVSRGRVLLTLQVDGRELLHVVDDGTGGRPLLRAGRVGLRGDNDEFLFDSFTARPIPPAAAPQRR
jgi:hypothetical protein